MNRLALTGEVVILEPLRYTPAGISLLSFVLKHQSVQTEAGLKRKVACEMEVIAMGELAEQIAKLSLGSRLNVAGFIANRSIKSKQLVLHLNKFEKIEG